MARTGQPLPLQLHAPRGAMIGWSVIRLASFVGVLTATACHPSLQSTSQLPPPTKQVAAVNAELRVSVFVPGRYIVAAASHDRRPSYLPLTVNSIAFTQTESGGAVVSGTPQVLTIGSIACSPSTGGQTCSTTLVSALGQDQWTVTSYTSSNGTGSALSIATLTKTIIAGAANTSLLTLNPVLHAMAFVPTGTSCNAASTCTSAVVVNALDITGATIIGPGNFVNSSGAATPITLSAASVLALQTTGGASANTTLNQTSDNTIGQFAYDGSANAGTKTITAAATGVTTATFTLTLTTGSITAPATVSIGDTNPTSTTFAVSESGYVGPFSETDTCTGIATIGSASGNGPSATFPVTQVAGGTCTVTVTDNHGGSTSVSILSTTYVVTLQ